MSRRPWFAAVLLVLASALAGAPPQAAGSPAIQLRITQAQGGTLRLEPLRVTRTDLRVEVAANLAVTELSFRIGNPNPLTVEGELLLPLWEEQKVAGFALDMGGRMREASVVDSGKASMVYQSIVARRVDPGLLEAQKGDTYRLRIFPIPPMGFRQVRVRLEQALRPLPEGFRLRLPLSMEQMTDKVSLDLLVDGAAGTPVLEESPLPGLDLKQQGRTWSAAASGGPLQLSGRLSLLLPLTPDLPSASVAMDRDRTWAYAHLRLPAFDEAKPSPRRIVLAWDCSIAARGRDRAREWAAVEDHLRGCPDAEVEVWAFSRSIIEKRIFPRAGRETETLWTYLRGLPAVGSCNLGALDLRSPGAQEVLLCSPAFRSFYKSMPRTGQVPVQILLGSGSPELPALRALARATGGEAYDLTTRDRSEVRRLLRRLPFQFLGAEVLEGEVEDLLPSRPRPVRGGMGLACVLRSSRARIRVRFGRSGSEELVRIVELSNAGAARSPIPRRLWAATRLEELEAEQPRERGALRDLAVEHGLVTRDTSLLVLETLGDYQRHGIPLPEDLRTQASAAAGKAAPSPRARAEARPELPDFSADLRSWLRARARWWFQPFPATARRAADQGFRPPATREDANREMEPPPPPPPPPGPGAGVETEVWCAGIELLPALGYPGGMPAGDEDAELRPGQRLSSFVPRRLLEMNMSPSLGDAVADGPSPMLLPSVNQPAAGAAPQAPRVPGFVPGPRPAQEPMPLVDPGLPMDWPQPLAPEKPARAPRHWRPGGDRAQALAHAPGERQWTLFLSYQRNFCASTAFHADCARILAASGQRERALAVATSLLEPLPAPEEEGHGTSLEGDHKPSPQRLLALAELLWESGELEEAAQAFQELLRQHPGQRTALLRLARLETQRGRNAEAQQLLERAIQALPGQDAFDPLQGVATEELDALKARLGQSREAARTEEAGEDGEDETPPAALRWGLRVEVEGIFMDLPGLGISLVDPRGERVWQDMPLGTTGLGMDGANGGGLVVFMARRPLPGPYHLQLLSTLFQPYGHRPADLRVRVTTGYGTREAKIREYRIPLKPTAPVWTALSFEVPERKRETGIRPAARLH